MPVLSALVFLAASATAAPAAKPAPACLPYEPESVQLTGRLARDQAMMVKPGAVPSPHEYLVLQLSTPVCTSARKNDEWNLSRRGVKRVQVEAAADAAGGFGTLVGKTVRCSGTLFFAKSNAHHTAVVMSASSCQVVN